MKKLPFFVIASLVTWGSDVYANDSNIVKTTVAKEYAKKEQDNKSLQAQFQELKQEWVKKKEDNQQKIQETLAENKRLSKKLTELEKKFNDLKQSSATTMSANSVASAVDDESTGGTSDHIQMTSSSHASTNSGSSVRSDQKGKTVKDNRPTTVRNRGGAITYVGDDSDFGPETMFEAFPSSQVPYYLLKTRDHFGDRALVFGGYLESDATGFWGDDFNAKDGQQTDTFVSTGNYKNGFNLNLTTATLDVMANINKWVQAFFSISSMDITTPFIQNAFVTFGNLDENPFFLTVGKNRIPMGNWAGGGPWLSGITQGYFRPEWFTNAMVGYIEGGLNINLSGFVPETDADTGFTNEGNFMVSTFYNGTIPGDSDISYGILGSFLWNWANTGMGASNKEVVDSNNNVSLEARQDRNSIINIEGNIAYKDAALFAGWAGTTFAKSYTNDSLAGAWYINPTYSPEVLGEVTVFGLSYGQAYNTNEFFFPAGGQASFGVSIKGVEREFIAYVQRPVLSPQVLVGLEYGWLGLYEGGGTNEVTLDLSVYF